MILSALDYAGKDEDAIGDIDPRITMSGPDHLAQLDRKGLTSISETGRVETRPVSLQWTLSAADSAARGGWWRMSGAPPIHAAPGRWRDDRGDYGSRKPAEKKP